jgi:hypothetical protein
MNLVAKSDWRRDKEEGGAVAEERAVAEFGRCRWHEAVD